MLTVSNRCMAGLLLLASLQGCGGDSVAMGSPIGNQLWGRSATITPGHREVLVQASTDDEKPYLIGVQADATFNNQGTADAVLGHLEVQWGSLGGQNTATIDLVKGLSFNVFGSYIRVDVFNDVPASFSGPSVNLVASASAGYSSAKTGRPPQFTIRSGVIAPTLDFLFAVPHYANTFQFLRRPFATSPYQIRFLPSSGVGIIAESDVAAGADRIPIPIPNGTAIVQVTNTSAVVPIADSAGIFELSL